MATEISLNCWVLGSGIKNVFSVDILSSKTTGQLKKAIKMEIPNKLAHIAADELDIWKVSDSAQHAHHY